MTRGLPLALRTFLLSFPPWCLVVIASFLAVHQVIKVKVKESLKGSLYQSEAAIEKAESDYKRFASQFLVILSENSGLKAAFGLLREAPPDAEFQDAVRRTIQASLWDLGTRLDYDFLAASDSRGKLIAAIVGHNGPGADVPSLPAPGESRLIRAGKDYFEATATMVKLGGENLGSLTYGRKLDIASLAQAGQIALIQNGKLLLSNLPRDRHAELEKQLAAHPAWPSEGRELSLAGETYLVLPVQKAQFGEEFGLLSLQSLDAATAQLTGSLGVVLVTVTAVGLLLLLVLSAVGSRSTAKPLTQLIEHLERSGETGRLQPAFPALSPVKEVNRLARAFNRAAESVRESQAKLEEAYVQFVETMAGALDARDCYTAGHSNRVCAYSTMIARALKLSPETTRTIRVGAQLHDIGKIGVPDSVLQKPGPLSERELYQIRMHPRIGRRILEKLERFADILPIVELHHENHDGSGYPHGLRGDEIPLIARIVHVADAYDAMSSNRAYRKALPQIRVLEELRKHAGAQFDPEVVEVFVALMIEMDAENLLHDCNLEKLGHALSAPDFTTSLKREPHQKLDLIDIGRRTPAAIGRSPAEVAQLRSKAKIS